jgi:hypothetical protein
MRGCRRRIAAETRAALVEAVRAAPQGIRLSAAAQAVGVCVDTARHQMQIAAPAAGLVRVGHPSLARWCRAEIAEDVRDLARAEYRGDPWRSVPAGAINSVFQLGERT